MTPAERASGCSQRSPSAHSQAIFSSVTMTSPKAASTIGLPESRALTVQIAAWFSRMKRCRMRSRKRRCEKGEEAHAFCAAAAAATRARTSAAGIAGTRPAPSSCMLPGS